MGLTGAEYGRVLKGPVHKLRAHWHAARTKAGAYRQRRLALQVEGDGEIRHLKRRPFRHLVNGPRLTWLRTAPDKLSAIGRILKSGERGLRTERTIIRQPTIGQLWTCHGFVPLL